MVFDLIELSRLFIQGYKFFEKNCAKRSCCFLWLLGYLPIPKTEVFVDICIRGSPEVYEWLKTGNAVDFP